MRLRLTVRRHSLPETTIIWVVDSSPSPTIAELLESVNESIPIESDEWGFEDYAVEVKGNGGVDYECLHYQQVSKVFKEDDEVIIRPLLTQDIRRRKRSGRHQISADGYRLYDGLAYGKTLTRALANRPEIKIPPRKRRRVTYHDEEDDEDDGQGSIAALEDQAVSESGDSNKQLVLHAEFDDEDEDDDEDFAPGADEDPEADIDSHVDEELESSSDEEEEQQAAPDTQHNEARTPDQEDKDDLLKITNEALRIKTVKLHSVFPESHIAICKHMLANTKGDMSKAYDAMTNGYTPIKAKSAFLANRQKSQKSSSKTRTKSKKASQTEIGVESEADAELKILSIPKTRSKHRKSPQANLEVEDLSSHDMLPAPKVTPKRKRVSQPDPEPESEIEAEDEPELELQDEGFDFDEEEDEEGEENEDPRIKFHDQNGFAPGFIVIEKVKTVGSEQADKPSSRPNSGRSNSMTSNKSVRSAEDEPLLKGLTSTPFIDQEEQEDKGGSEASSEDSSEDDIQSEDETSSSEDSDSSGSDSSDSSDSDTSQIVGATSATIPVSDSDSDSDSSSNSSSEDDAPEEITSKSSIQNVSNAPPEVSSSAEIIKPTTKQKSVAPGQGRIATQARNLRRKNQTNVARYKEQGILPADTTVKEFQQLTGLTMNSSPAEALAALNSLRGSTSAPTQEQGESTGLALSKSDEFNRRREELLASLANGGVEIGQNSSNPEDAMFEQEIAVSVSNPSTIESGKMIESQSKVIHDPIVSESIPVPSAIPVNAPSAPEDLPIAPETFANDAPTLSGQAPPVSAESSRIASARRSKLDVGASARLLFGSLGFRAPKSKKDEKKIRNTLMKDVRPLKTPNEMEVTTVGTITEATEDNPDSWRDTINYRAVECVQEGIELSEPPFPFVQRWDPQQQNPWKKRKKEQADQSDYVDDNRASKKQKQRKGKHNYQEEQEYLDESYQPTYQDESSLVTNVEDPSQPGGEDMEDAISQQLMNEIQPLIRDASHDPDDLTPLPENTNSLPSLQDGKSQVGMIIAYKTLECSAETRWQPQLSDYRTAIVIAIQGNGELTLTLAKRDRKKNNYDETTGERVYTKFEMVDLDEEEEDDGMVYITFGEMAEPKIVQEASTDLHNGFAMDETTKMQDRPSFSNSVTPSKEGLFQDSVQEESQLEFEESQVDAQFSHVTETPLHSDAHGQENHRNAVETSFQSEAPDGSQAAGDNAEESDHSEASSPERIDDEVPGSPNHSDDQDSQSRDMGDGDHATSDADDEQVEDTEELPEAQLEEDNTRNSANSNGCQADTDDFQKARQEDDNDILETSTLSDLNAEHIEDTEVLHDAQQEDYTNQTSFISNAGTDYVESISGAQAQEEMEEEEISTSRDSTPKASAMQRSTTPSMQLPQAAVNNSTNLETVSDSDRREISHLIKDAGFRSSVASSVMRDVPPNVLETPGDEAVFEKLLNDMEPRSAQPTSPRFNNFSSSPIRKEAASPSQREPSQTPTPLQSSWVTVDEPISSQPLPPLQKEIDQDSQDWETASEDQPSSPPVLKSSKREPVKVQPRKRVPIGNAQAMWEQLSGSRSSTHSPVESNQASLEPEPTKEDKYLYPKLLTQSSFSGQLAQFDQQPELDLISKTTSVVVEKESDVSTTVIPSTGHDLQQNARLQETHTDIETVTRAPRPRLSSRSPISARIEELLNSPPKRLPTLPRVEERTPSPEQAAPRKTSPLVEAAPITSIERAFTPEKPRSPTPIAIPAVFPPKLPTPEKIQARRTTSVIEKASPIAPQLKDAHTQKAPFIVRKSLSPEEALEKEAAFIIHKSLSPQEAPAPKKAVTKPAPVDLDSDDDFPSIEDVVSNSQKALKVEKRISNAALHSSRKSVDKRRSFGLDGTSEEFGDSDRRSSSQNHNRSFKPRPSQGRDSENSFVKSKDLQQSQSRTIKTRDSQPPASSQSRLTVPPTKTFIDLSLSSDVEADDD